MSLSFKEASEQILAVVRNARQMATKRQDRRLAMDVLRACSLFAKGINYPCDPEIFEKLASSIIDKTTLAMMEEFANLENTLMKMAALGNRKNPPKLSQ